MNDSPSLSEIIEKKLNEKKTLQVEQPEQAKQNEQDENIGRNDFFKVQSASTWISEAAMRPTPKKLFDGFWYENELCILFADTNTGKSILAVQIGDSISSGIPINGFCMDADQQEVLYLDFELSGKQFQIRYTNSQGELYQFSSNLIRAAMNGDCDLQVGMSFEQLVIRSLEDTIVKRSCKILIIDNITYLREDNEKGRDALSMMKELKALKSKYDLSILCLAHVPKRDNSKPLNRNDLAGSKMLINFCDSAFAIGESSSDSSIRYLKQIKTRNDTLKYGAENVAVFQIEKNNCFLHFAFKDFAAESEFLRQPSKEDKEKRMAEAQVMKSEGKTNKQIGEYFHVSEGAVRKWFKSRTEYD